MTPTRRPTNSAATIAGWSLYALGTLCGLAWLILGLLPCEDGCSAKRSSGDALLGLATVLLLVGAALALRGRGHHRD